MHARIPQVCISRLTTAKSGRLWDPILIGLSVVAFLMPKKRALNALTQELLLQYYEIPTMFRLYWAKVIWMNRKSDSDENIINWPMFAMKQTHMSKMSISRKVIAGGLHSFLIPVPVNIQRAAAFTRQANAIFPNPPREVFLARFLLDR